MIYIKPSFYYEFECIASRCKDNCCIGWEIDVDDASYQKYSSIPGELGEKIRSKITVSEDGSRCFELQENDRCPFLDGNNLCRIITAYGKGYLCDICREHPRFYNWFPGITECGLGLSCEEVCRILLNDEKHFELIEEKDIEETVLKDKQEIYESDFYIFLAGLRDDFYKILSRNGWDLPEKLVKILEKTEEFCGEKIKIKNYKKLVDEYKKTEPIDEQWTLYINRISDNLDDIVSVEQDFDIKTKGDELYSKILAYIIFRHLSSAVFDKSVLERVRFCVESVRFIKLCNMKTFSEKGSLTLEDYIINLKNWSKQVEYSSENTDFLIYGELD